MNDKKTKVLVYHVPDTLKKSLSDEFLQTHQIACTFVDAVSKAIGLIAEAELAGAPFNLLISVGEADGIGLILYLKKKTSYIPIFFYNNTPVEDPSLYRSLNVLGITEASDSAETLIEKALAELNEREVRSDQIENGTLTEEFCPIRPQLLLKICPLKTDIYLRLNPKKYLKIFQSDDQFDRGDYQKYFHSKQVEFFYIRKGESNEILSSLKKMIIDTLDDPNTTPDAAFEAATEAQETVMELVARIGFSPEIQEMSKTAMDVTIKTIRQDRSLNRLMAFLKRGENKYINTHGVAVAQISGMLAIGLGWDSEATLQKLTMSAFFHDVYLVTQYVGEAPDIQDFESRISNFGKDELNLYYQHPLQGAEFVKQFKKIPADVDQIILQHHELPDGTGFPRGIKHNYISPLASIFIVAHFFANAILRDKKNFDFEDQLAEARSIFNQGVFNKILDALEDFKF